MWHFVIYFVIKNPSIKVHLGITFLLHTLLCLILNFEINPCEIILNSFIKGKKSWKIINHVC
jgi:hypothetical protein